MSAKTDQSVSLRINDRFKEEITEEINKKLIELQRKKFWIWSIFLVCFTPGIFNGMNVYSVIFLAKMPSDYWCIVPQLSGTNWTSEQIREISRPKSGVSKECHVFNWDYNRLAALTYEEAAKYVNTQTPPKWMGCHSMNGQYFYMQEVGLSIVTEWHLVCEREMLRTLVQVLYFAGKFVGACAFGVISDKYGRKRSFIISCVLFLASGFAVTSSDYVFFLIGRFVIGATGVGMFHAGHTIVMEVASNEQRVYLSVLFLSSYPIGILIVVLIAYLIRPWKYLSIAVAVPSVLLFISIFFLIESPRWLITKEKYNEAYAIVFKEQLEIDKTSIIIIPKEPRVGKHQTVKVYMKKFFREFINLYGPAESRRKLLICHYNWIVVSLIYYTVALDNDNFNADPFLYGALIAVTELPCYIFSIVALLYYGRTHISCALLVSSGIVMLLIIPSTNHGMIISLAIIGRTFTAGVYAIIILHTSELFSTEVRNTAIGICSSCSHVGSISAPFVVDFLGKYVMWHFPTTICAIFAILAGFLITRLPETRGTDLRDKVEIDLVISDNDSVMDKFIRSKGIRE